MTSEQRDPQVAVNIVTHNSAATIEACLIALRSQESVNFRASVFDNASTDETVPIVRRIGVAIETSGHNIGYAAAHNALIDQTRSAYVLTLNPDVFLRPGFLAAMVRALDGDDARRVGSAAGLLLRTDAPDLLPFAVDSAGLYMRRNRRQGLRLDGAPIPAKPLASMPIFGPDGAAAFYRRAMLDDVRVQGQVFDSDFFMHKEDIDLCWRAQLYGWTSAFVPDAVATHIRTFRPGQRRGVSAELRAYAVRNRYLMMLKNERGAHFRRDLLSILFYDLKILIYLALREWASLAGIRSAWALRGRMIEKRRVIQSGARTSWHELQHWFVGEP
jgi:GT2 family glycosyltransferase